MLKNRSRSRLLLIILSLWLTLSSYNVVIAQEQTSDINGHWAEVQISNWIAEGWIKGYGDGTFRPDHPITRGELIALVNRAFEFTERASIQFTDIHLTNWVYPEIQIAIHAGYIRGYEDNTIRAAKTVSRQEAASIIAGLLNLTGDTSAANGYADSAAIASWSKGAVGAAAATKIIQGYADNTFRPTKPVTRAEAIVILDRALIVKKPTQASAFDKAGIYGPASGSETISDHVTITVGDVTLRNMILNGNLLLAESIGEGDVFLDNVTVKGTTTILGGGAHSVHLKDTVLLKVIVNKLDNSVRVVIEGSSTIKEVILQSGAILEEAIGASGGGFHTVTLAELLPEESTVELVGSYETVDIHSKRVNVSIPKGTIKNLKVAEHADDTNIQMSDEALKHNIYKV